MSRIVIALVLLAVARPAAARQTNAEQMGHLAVECVSPRTSGLDPIRIDGPERLPFVRSAVVSAWKASGVTVYEAGSETQSQGATVRLRIERAGVDYEKAGRDSLRRTVTLGLLVSVSDAQGRILHDDACSDRRTDRVAKSTLDMIENPVWPETVGKRPPDGFFKRILHPVVVTAATAVGVLLFFSLRSRRADDGG